VRIDGVACHGKRSAVLMGNASSCVHNGRCADRHAHTLTPTIRARRVGRTCRKFRMDIAIANVDDV
jgi:hypothetical protein